MAIFGKKKNTENDKKIDKLELIGEIVGKLGMISDINVTSHTIENNVTNKQLEEVCSKLNYCIKQIQNEENTNIISAWVYDIYLVLSNVMNKISFNDESLQYALIAKDLLEFCVENNVKNDEDVKNNIDVIIEYMNNKKISLSNSINLCKDSIEKTDVDTQEKIENKIKRYELHINIIDIYVESTKTNSSKIEINMVDDEEIKILKEKENIKNESTESKIININVDNDKELEEYKKSLKKQIDNELKEYKEKALEEIDKQKEQAEQDILKYKRDLRKKFDNEILQYGSDEQKRIKGVLSENNDVSVEELIENKGNTLTEEKQKEEIANLKEELELLLQINEEYKNKEEVYTNKIEKLNTEIEDLKNNNEENINQNLIKKTEEINNLLSEIESLNKEKELNQTERNNLEDEIIELRDKIEKLEENISFYEEEINKNNDEFNELTSKLENKDKEIVELKQENSSNLLIIENLQVNEKKYLDTIENLEIKIQNENENGKTKYLLELEDVKLKMSKENNTLQEKINNCNEEIEKYISSIEELSIKNEECLIKENEYKQSIENLENELIGVNEELEEKTNDLNSKVMIIESKDSVIEELEKKLANSDKTEIIEKLENEIAELKNQKTEKEKSLENMINELNDTIISINNQNSELQNKIDRFKGQTIVLPNVLMINPYTNLVRQVDESRKKNVLFSPKKNIEEIEKKEFILSEYDYKAEFVENDKESLTLVSECNNIKDICIFSNKKYYYIGFAKSYDGKKYDNNNYSLVKLNRFDEIDIEIFTKPINEEMLNTISKENLVAKLSAYYQFVIWYYNKNIANSNLNINDLIEFKKYYNEIIKSIYPTLESDYKLCIDILTNANKKVLLLKLFGMYYENENEIIGDYINNELNNSNDSKLNSDINNIMRMDVVLPELLETINNSYFEEKSENNKQNIDTTIYEPQKNEELFRKENTSYQPIFNSYLQENKLDKPLTMNEKIDNVNTINFSNIKYIVKKQNINGLVDVSGYSFENVDVAINQYVFMEAFYKEIGIKYNDELIFIFGKNNNTKSAMVLDERAKHINKWDKGVIGEIISYYENKLGKMIAEYER